MWYQVIFNNRRPNYYFSKISTGALSHSCLISIETMVFCGRNFRLNVVEDLQGFSGRGCNGQGCNRWDFHFALGFKEVRMSRSE